MRVYSIEFANVSVSAVQDLLTVFCGTSKAVKLHSIVLGQTTGTSVQNLNISLKRLPATVTPGSGGTAPVPQPVNPGDAAPTITAHANDTTRSTTSGTAQIMLSDVINTVNGYLFLPPAEDRIIAGPGQALVLSLDTAPASPMAISGTVVVEELF
jgi:hypothetical protein